MRNQIGNPILANFWRKFRPSTTTAACGTASSLSCSNPIIIWLWANDNYSVTVAVFTAQLEIPWWSPPAPPRIPSWSTQEVQIDCSQTRDLWKIIIYDAWNIYAKQKVDYRPLEYYAIREGRVALIRVLAGTWWHVVTQNSEMWQRKILKIERGVVSPTRTLVRRLCTHSSRRSMYMSACRKGTDVYPLDNGPWSLAEPTKTRSRCHEFECTRCWRWLSESLLASRSRRTEIRKPDFPTQILGANCDRFDARRRVLWSEIDPQPLPCCWQKETAKSMLNSGTDEILRTYTILDRSRPKIAIVRSHSFVVPMAILTAVADWVQTLGHIFAQHVSLICS